MKQLISILLSVIFIINMNCTIIAAEVEGVLSESYIVMDAKTGQVLLSKDPTKQMFPASITKVLTCALVMEKGDVNSKANMTNEIVKTVPRDTSHIALTDGEEIPVTDLLYAAMIPSANDAAHCLAFYLSGSMEAFVEEMNTKAKEIGSNSSNFVNASGLHDENHYTTAYDMALITKWALSIEGFEAIFNAQEYTMSPTNKQPKERYWATKSKMLYPDLKQYYEGVKGSKTGWTPEAQHTLITTAERNGVELIAVVMKTQGIDEKFDDTKLLFDEAFNKYDNVTFPKQKFAHPAIPIKDGETIVGEVNIIPEDISITRSKTIAKADIKIDMNVPTYYNIGDEIKPTVKFLAGEIILSENPLKFEKTDIGVKSVSSSLTINDEKGFKIQPWMIFTVAFIAFLIFVLFAIRAYNLYKREERRRKKAAQMRRKNLQNRRTNNIDIPLNQARNTRNSYQNKPRR